MMMMMARSIQEGGGKERRESKLVTLREDFIVFDIGRLSSPESCRRVVVIRYLDFKRGEGEREEH